MPIRISRGDSTDEPLQNDDDQPQIVVETSDKPAVEAEITVVSGQDQKRTHSSPAQTSWVMALCQCTLTGGSYQLAFRQDGDTYALVSIDSQIGTQSTQGLDGIKGRFDWSGFKCVECDRTWHEVGGDGVPWPVILCTCESLFCTRKGLYSKDDKGSEEWWWRCPKCKRDSRIARRTIESLKGQALKGKVG